MEDCLCGRIVRDGAPRDRVAMASIPIVDRARAYVERRAVIDDAGEYTFAELLERSAFVARRLLIAAQDLAEARVAFMVPPSMQHVVVQWGIWRAGGVAVPLCLQHPPPELEYTIDDSQSSIVIAHPDFADCLRPIAESRGLRLLTVAELDAGPVDAGRVDAGRVDDVARLPKIDVSRRAMLLYTSGTTNKPKGAVTTHEIITAQIQSLVEAWEWTENDHILHLLPLHHLHGILNVTCCAMWSGATCEFLPRFDADRVWDRIAVSDSLTLFMAVPTIYSRLTRAWEEANEERQRAMSEGCRRLRLMVSGSAALPVPTLEKWRELSGHTLLERYGMTEIGMGLSNPLHGQRQPGCVGAPLPGVELRLVDEANRPVSDGAAGQIQVRGPTVFTEYWGKSAATTEAFTDDGWFKTGDVAQREDGVYRILGRESVDIIKTGGYKVSALEIEDVLRTHEQIDECAVVGVADEEWGQRVAVAAVITPEADLKLEDLRAWCKQQLAAYKVPSLMKTVDALPRNPMGKVTKPDVVELFES